ncbi:hypothetical protein C0991_005543 [Blastosporella zonata]|nr:hypothetical protein C0991_005543 [Blastosporella zonata]
MHLQLSFIPLAVSLVFLLSATETAATVNVVHYPPNATNINNLAFALNGSGAPGIYTSSVTPTKVYGEYNWCNMPHVRTREYKTPSRDFTLEYVEWQAFTNQANPWTNTVGPGFVGSTCQLPQITEEGLEDSITHGEDLRAVYATRLGLGLFINPSTAQIRVTNNQITSQVASGLLKGLFPASTGIQALIQSSTYDSLEPTYSCNKANSLKNAITGNPAWTNHLTAAAGIYAQLDAISGTASHDSAGWHSSFDHYYDNMSAKQCHGKTLPCNVNATSQCVSQDIANTVYRLGNWEYSWQFRDAPESAQYSALHYGAWILELQGHLQDKISGKSQMKYFHNIAHDGSVSPLLGFLQISNMVWPGMGSEVVFELYSKSSASSSGHDNFHSSKSSGTKSYFLRVLWGGQPMVTSTPLGTLDMIPIDDFFSYISSMIGSGSDLFAACNLS